MAVFEAGPVAAGVTGYTTAKVTALQRTTASEIARRHGPERARAYVEANRAAVGRPTRRPHAVRPRRQYSSTPRRGTTGAESAAGRILDRPLNGPPYDTFNSVSMPFVACGGPAVPLSGRKHTTA